jgi:pterin-4a-carbinolamine dehydratase
MKFASRHRRTAEHISSFTVAQNIMLKRQRRFFDSGPSYDPLARRPNEVCDPYGQGGKPLSREDAQGLLATVEKDWRLVPEDSPTGLIRDFHHENFMEGSQFVGKIAAVAHMNNHYPSIQLERKLLPRSWQVATTVKCSTPTLKGLSYNDFHIAMVSASIECIVHIVELKLLTLSLAD